MDFLTLLIAKYGSHEKLATATGKSRQAISYNNLITDKVKRNSFGLELLLLINDDITEIVSCNGKLLTFKIEKL